ncbi:glycerate kinase [Halalkalibacter urbisdiaboli]|uniref:glycerate kinase n=1 Tax=Halalkalibacter urbisdiaboli TaxID=1960589 RepID=UPI000B435341|nr:glycerate kinase [Halalkalibacter urbisdiaboli]
MKKIVIAPDSFKESFSARQAAVAIETGFKRIFPEAIYEKIPMADGGEGTVQSLVDAWNGTLQHVEVVGPLGHKITASYGLSGDSNVAVIEMAAASGLHLVPREKRNPLYTTSYGTGQLIVDALEKGAQHIILGIGGSATNDGGAGLAQALGVQLKTREGEAIAYGGSALSTLHEIDLSIIDPRLQDVTIEVACDVDNPLLGPEGAAAIYGPQKGATDEMIETLDQCLAHYATIIYETTGKDVRQRAGAGAAGGLGAGLLAFLDVRLERGINLILAATKFSERMKGADLVITGEGRLDRQTVFGKTPIGVATAAKLESIPVIAIAGQLAPGHDVIFEHGIDAAFSIVPSVISLDDAFENGLLYLEQTATNIARTLKLRKCLQ